MHRATISTATSVVATATAIAAMLPPARLLLVLATILATTHAESNCKVVVLGQTTQQSLLLPDVSVPSPGGQLYIPDNCPNQGYGQVVGERVRACNNYEYGYAPQVSQASPRQLQYLNVVCTDGCVSGVTVTVVQYCSAY